MNASGRVLIVDDNELNREILARRLERFGYTFGMAQDGAEALEKMREQDGNAYDLVLLDIMMPVMTGYEVLEAAKSEAALKQIPIVVISAVNELESVVRCIELGAEDYLFKPFNTVLLRARLAACIERKRMRAAVSAVEQPIELTRKTIAELQEHLSDLLTISDGSLSDEQVRLLEVIGRCIRVLVTQAQLTAKSVALPDEYHNTSSDDPSGSDLLTK